MVSMAWKSPAPTLGKTPSQSAFGEAHYDEAELGQTADKPDGALGAMAGGPTLTKLGGADA